jgi:hypothetical protein
MTIREIVRAKCKLPLLLGVASLIALGIEVNFPPSEFLLFLAPVVGLAGCIIYLQSMVVCPKCFAPFGRILNRVVLPSFAPAPCNFCPKCGVALDSHE